MDRSYLHHELELWAIWHHCGGSAEQEVGWPQSVPWVESGQTFADKMAAEHSDVDVDRAAELETVINDIGYRHKPRKDAIHYRYLKSDGLWCATYPYDLEMAFADLLRILPTKPAFAS